MTNVVNSPAAVALAKVGKPLGSLESLKDLRAASEVKCTKKAGEPCVATQQVPLIHNLTSNCPGIPSSNPIT